MDDLVAAKPVRAGSELGDAEMGGVGDEAMPEAVGMQI